MAENDPEWRPGNRAVRERGGPVHVQEPEPEDLDAEVEGRTVWIRGRVIKQEDGSWKRNEGRISKRVYPV